MPNIEHCVLWTNSSLKSHDIVDNPCNLKNEKMSRHRLHGSHDAYCIFRQGTCVVLTCLNVSEFSVLILTISVICIKGVQGFGITGPSFHTQPKSFWDGICCQLLRHRLRFQRGPSRRQEIWQYSNSRHYPRGVTTIG